VLYTIKIASSKQKLINKLYLTNNLIVTDLDPDKNINLNNQSRLKMSIFPIEELDY